MGVGIYSEVEGIARQCFVRNAAAQGIGFDHLHLLKKKKSVFYLESFFLKRCFIKLLLFMKHWFAIMLNSSCLSYAFLLI